VLSKKEVHFWKRGCQTN